MKDEAKTKKQLIGELNELRRYVNDLKGHAPDGESKKLNQRNEKFAKAFLENATPIFITTIKEGKFIDVSDAFVEMTGFERDEIIGKTSMDLGFITGEQRAWVLNKIRQKGRIADLELLIKIKSNELRYGLFNINTIRLDDEDYLLSVVMDITNQKQAEKALKESEELYRTFINATSDMVFLKDEKLRNIVVNKSLARFFGKSEQDIIGKSDFELMPKEAAEGCFKTDMEAQKAASVITSEEMIADQVYETVKFPVDLGHKRTGVGAFIHNITDRKKAEANLRESEEKLRLISENAKVIIWMTDMNFNFSYISPYIKHMLGYSPGECAEKPLNEMLMPHSLKAVQQLLDEELAIEKTPDRDLQLSRTIEVEQIHRDGKTVWTEVNVTFIRDANGNATGILGITADITERKKIEQQLHESEQFFRSIVENSHAGIYAAGDDFRFTYANRKLCDISGYTREELLGNDLRFLIAEESLPLIADRYIRRRRGEDVPVSYEFVGIHKNGEKRSFEGNTTVIRIADGQLRTIGQILDVTDRKRAENIMIYQRDLALALTKSTSLQNTLELCLDASVKATGLDSGAIYIADLNTGDLNLACILGVSGWFAKSVSRFAHDSERTKLIMQGNPHYIEGNAMSSVPHGEALSKEGIKSLALIPIINQNNIIGSMSIASHVFENIPQYCRNIAETIAGQVGTYIARAQSEEALRESESKFRDLAEKSVVGIYLIQDDCLKYVNAEFGKIFGYSVEEMVDRMGAKDIIYHEDLPLVEERLRQRITGKLQSIRYNFRIQTKDRGVRNAEVFSSRTFYRGKPAVIGTVLDITDRLKAEEESRRLSVAIEQAAEDIIITDPEGIIQYVNPAFEKITGYSRVEAIGQKPRILKSGVHDPAFYENLWDTIKGGNIWKGRLVNRCQDGRLVQEDATITPLINSQGRLTGYVALKRDVTEAVKLETQFRQSQKMEAIGTLAGGISHDFNNILAAMMGYAELAKTKVKDEKVFSYLEQILVACDRARELVKQILTFSRQTEQEKKPVMMIPLIKEVAKFMRASLPRTIEIKQSLHAAYDMVMADATQMHQLLMNLCTNAGYAMKASRGMLEISLEEVTIRPDDSLYPSLKGGRYLQLSVLDTGHGIPQDHLERIFEPYFTTKEKEEGTGLGLSVVDGIVKSHGGAVKVYSEVGKGSVFHVYLPLVEGNEKNADRGTKTEPLPGGNETILLIDDEKMLTRVANLSLEELGYTVVTANDPSRAIDLFSENKEKFDLVITDKTMPGITGFDVALAIKNIRSDIPIILCTGFQDREDSEKLASCGISAYIPKPIRISLMARSIRDILDKKTD